MRIQTIVELRDQSHSYEYPVIIPENTVLDVIDHDNLDKCWRVMHNGRIYHVKHHDARIYAIDEPIADIFKKFSPIEWPIVLVAARLALADTDVMEQISEYTGLPYDVCDDVHEKLHGMTDRDALERIWQE